jgi:D-beta-D-heptose 7-phosphate kinase/D-beta-D-heptose 1-phosphate adenosyltransferase
MLPMSIPLAELLARLPHHSILVVGDVMLDEYLEGDSSRVSPEAPVPIVRFSGTRSVPGGAANTAANAVALGGRATLLGITGDDVAGRELAEACETRGIRLIALQDGRPTTRKVRVLGQRQQLLRVDYEASTGVDSATEARLLAECAREIDRAGAVVISDYAKGVVTKRLCQQVIALARSAGKAVIIDPRPQHAAYYAGCDYLTPNWKEARALLGWPDEAVTDEEVHRTGRAVAERFGCSAVLTLGPRGISLFPRDGGEPFTAAAAAREVFDVSGAGDTVVAAFALATAAGASAAESATFANHAAAIVVGKHGTATVSPREMLMADDAEPRLVRRNDLGGLAAALRALGKRMVTINGSFDVLHAGHLHILKVAKQQGDVLVVGLNSDSSVGANKGPTRPIVPQAQRADMLLAIRYVDYVHIFDEPAPMAFIAAVRPDVHVNGAEYGEDCVEAAVVREIGARLHLVPRIEGFSSSGVIRRL